MASRLTFLVQFDVPDVTEWPKLYGETDHFGAAAHGLLNWGFSRQDGTYEILSNIAVEEIPDEE